MNDLLSRAAALEGLLKLKDIESQIELLSEAVVACCQELVDAGEPQLALSLADNSEKLALVASRNWSLRLAIVRIAALRVAGEFQQSFGLAGEVRRNFADVIVARSNE